jgi:hypothetical protein
MKKEIIHILTKSFEEASHTEQGIEYWMARDIQELLEYNEWRNFLNVIDKAKIACQNSRQSIENHFVDVNKMVKLGSGSDREIPDIMLSRYACYLIAQNALYEHGVDYRRLRFLRSLSCSTSGPAYALSIDRPISRQVDSRNS